MPIQRQFRELRWPFSGLHQGLSWHGQPHDTTVACQNVRNYEPATGRSRGAQRPGLTRYLDDQVTGTGSKQIQDINSLVTVPAAAGSLTNLSARQQTNVAVCSGNVETFDTTSFTLATNGSGALSATAPVIFSAPLFSNLYFADGTNEKYLSGTTVSAWTATEGSLPSNGANTPRLIELWRSRIVLSGVRGDEHNWFMSRVNDATDFDYGATSGLDTIAVAGNNSEAGKIGDVINTMIPFTDDLLIFGCDHSIWQMSGDPAHNGTVDMISDMTGMAFGRPWCKIDDGSIMFVGSQGGIYRMAPNAQPIRLSADRLEESLQVVDLNTTIVRCAYDKRMMGVHFFFTPLDQSATTHYYYDLRRDAFFADVFADPEYNPVAVLTLDGDDPDDRVVLLGGFDRRIRKIDYSATNDDTQAIDSYVWLGPIRGEEGAKVHLRELIATLDDNCDGAYYEVYAAQGSQIAYSRGQLYHTGIWGPGRNGADGRRASGTALYIKVGNNTKSEYFAWELLMASLERAGLTAQRQAT